MTGGSALPPAVWALARGLLRRRRWASVALAVFAGLAAAVPMAVWAAGREAATTVDRSLEQARAADVIVTVCPPGFDPTTQDPAACLEYRPDGELATIRSVPGVVEAVRAGVTLVGVGSTPDFRQGLPAGARAVINLMDTTEIPTVMGEPHVVSGRLAAADAPDEVMLNEATAEALGAGPGHRVWLETGEAPEGAHDGGTLFPSTVVGVVRTVADLLPVQAESLGAPPIRARDGWSRAHADKLSPDQTLVLVWLDDGETEGFNSRLQAALGTRRWASRPPWIRESDRTSSRRRLSRAALLSPWPPSPPWPSASSSARP